MEAPDRCSYVQDFAPDGEVLREEEIQRLSSHTAQCLPCMEQFIALVRTAASGGATAGFGGRVPPEGGVGDRDDVPVPSA